MSTASSPAATTGIVDLVAACRTQLPGLSLLVSAEDVRPYECDGLSVYRAQPGAVLLPKNEAEVIAAMRLCSAGRVPVVARGAGTGLSGGAMPLAEGVVLSLAKLNRIIRIDAAARTALVQPGVRNLAISEAVAADALYYAPDPSSQIACTIGGNVAENSGGVHCLKYGLTVQNVYKVRAVLVDGTAAILGADALDAPGYDLLALIIGSEGLLGIATEVTVKLTPKPQTAQCAMAAFDDLVKAGAAVGGIIGAGIIPAGLEMMDKAATRAVEDFVHAGYNLEAQAILLVESDGTAEEVAEEMARIRDVLETAGAVEVRVSRDEAERLRFWAGRKAAFPAVGRISPDYYCIDGTIPRRALPEVLASIEGMTIEFGLRCANVFHAGDGNLHPLILFDANVPGELERTEAFAGRILELCIAVGGTITGEHGVGIEKINQMCLQFGAGELERFLGIKSAFDPNGLLNPGKAVPTLHRCAEFGRMHVHAGREKFPELPRF
ncbi:MAG: FAD-linked oxidase C-terminal domain-containing protein [Betaproteobacteria bacterium]